MQVERISTKPIYMIFRRASLQSSRCLGCVCFLNLFNLEFISGSIEEHPRSIQGPPGDQFGGGCGLQGPFCVEVTFQEIPKPWTLILLKFPVRVFDEFWRNRCGFDARLFPSHPFIYNFPIYCPNSFYVSDISGHHFHNFRVAELTQARCPSSQL